VLSQFRRLLLPRLGELLPVFFELLP